MISIPSRNGLESNDASVVVVGAGAAGMAAAISAARAGAKVFLLERHRRVGGTVANALIHTLGGIYDDQGEYLNQGIVVELSERLAKASSAVKPRQIGKTWTLSVCPDVYATVVADWLQSEPRLTVLTETTVDSVQVEGRRVVSIDISGPSGTKRLAAGEAIDTSGSAALVRMVNSELVCDDPHSAAGGLIFRMKGVQPGSLDFPNNVKLLRGLRKATASGLLPKECANTWLDRGVAEDEVYVKLSVPLTSGGLGSSSHQDLMRRVAVARSSVFEFLRSYAGFENATLDGVGELGIRGGGQIKGDYCLTEADVQQGRKFDDGVCRCCWPIEYWHPERGVSLEYLPEGSSYEIPLRSLKVQGFENLWAAGKCLSADHRAQASARIVGSCWSMGEAVGQAAVDRCLVGTSRGMLQ